MARARDGPVVRVLNRGHSAPSVCVAVLGADIVAKGSKAPDVDIEVPRLGFCFTLFV